MYELRFWEKFKERVAKAYRSRGQLRWVDGKTFFKDRKITVIVALPKKIPSVTLKPGETTDVKLPGNVEVVQIRGMPKVAEVTLNDKANSVTVVAGAEKGKAEFKLKYTLAQLRHLCESR